MNTTAGAKRAAAVVLQFADDMRRQIEVHFPPGAMARANWKYGQVTPSEVMLGDLYWAGQMFKIEVTFIATGRRKDIPLEQIVEVLP